jgi:hypothetical protein
MAFCVLQPPAEKHHFLELSQRSVLNIKIGPGLEEKKSCLGRDSDSEKRIEC